MLPQNKPDRILHRPLTTTPGGQCPCSCLTLPPWACGNSSLFRPRLAPGRANTGDKMLTWLLRRQAAASTTPSAARQSRYAAWSRPSTLGPSCAASGHVRDRPS